MQINRISNVNFGIKLPTEDVVNVVIGHSWDKKDRAGFVNVCQQMTGWDNIDFFTAMGISSHCTKSLVKQIPILKEIKDSSVDFFNASKKTPEEVKKWVDEQVEKCGTKELDVKPIQIDKMA